MNYAVNYKRLIDRARGRVLTGYRERHHVLPRCMGGTDDPVNLVDLTPEEHYVAHQLLAKMHPGRAGLVYAALLMAKKATGNKPYGWLRRRYGVMVKALMTGKPKSPLHVASMASVRMGHVVTEETRRKIADTKRGQTLSAEHRQKIGAALRGRKLSSEHVAKMAAVHKGRKRSDETRAKMSTAKRGKRGSPRTQEWQEKINNALRGRKRAPFSAECRANMSRGQRRRRALEASA